MNQHFQKGFFRMDGNWKKHRNFFTPYMLCNRGRFYVKFNKHACQNLLLLLLLLLFSRLKTENVMQCLL